MENQHPAGYLATSSAGNGRAVLVLHAWWGLNDTIRAFCDRLAKYGFVAFAPDLYHGKIADTIPNAESLSRALDANQAKRDIKAAMEFLREHAAHTEPGLAVIGFSLGASFALELSVTDPDQIREVVVFYGTRPGDYTGSKAAFLGHFAENDEFEPQEEVDNLEAALRTADRPVSFYRYPGTGHWFFEPDRPDAFNPAAASLAWERTLDFLKATRQP
jgi:carboxymethylenebutenolidase